MCVAMQLGYSIDILLASQPANARSKSRVAHRPDTEGIRIINNALELID